LLLSLDEYLTQAAQAHGHLCAGQILGVRLALAGLHAIDIDDPVRDRKRLVTFVEIDRCATDAIALVTGCRLGKRALKFYDWGKMAATFVDISTRCAVRISARDSAKDRARELFPTLEREPAQQQAYRTLRDDQLFDVQAVRVALRPEDLPGYKGPRVACDECGESINFHREVIAGGRTLCRSCAGERYYEPTL
jgi:formylmethanofuran dehydrogenase subunit E